MHNEKSTKQPSSVESDQKSESDSENDADNNYSTDHSKLHVEFIEAEISVPETNTGALKVRFNIFSAFSSLKFLNRANK